jgi:glutamate dehydrogenase (NAD(P)+)
MEIFLRERLPEKTWENRMIEDGDLRFMEFGPLDLDRLSRLGIVADKLGPHLVVCLWDARSDLEIGGYLVVDNLAMGGLSMGGVRMLPDITPATIFNLARGMTLKNAAAKLPYGGGKSGIVARRNLSVEEHNQVIKGFAHLLYRYKEIYIPGPDVGTNDLDMKTIAVENGMNHALSKPAEMGGNRIDQIGAAAGGTVIALEALLQEMPRLKALPQFDNLSIPTPDELTVIIQGFGAVGAHTARILHERHPGAKTVGVSDALGYIYNEDGLPVESLFPMWQAYGLVTRRFYLESLEEGEGEVSKMKYSTAPNDLLRESAFCMIPAAPIANYLDVDEASSPSVTTEKMGDWSVIIEAANTYSPDPTRKAARKRMEREVYRLFGTLIATDYLVNSGGVIFAAQEHLIRTPRHLLIPEEILGNHQAVEGWLIDHARELRELAEERRIAGENYRDAVIRRNMHELVDLLVSDPDMLPCEAAEQISIQRIAARERDKSAADIMVTIPTTFLDCTVREAAVNLVEAESPILAVLDENNSLAGVVTEWDITRATAIGSPDDQPVAEIMSRQVVAAEPTDGIIALVRKLEHHEISAMPVVEHGCVLGMVTADLLARRTLLRLLLSEEN